MKNKVINISKPYTNKDELSNLKKTMMSGWLAQGKMVQAFEEHFKNFHNSNFAIACSNCTTGLHLILKSLKIEKDDEIILPSFTWISTANSIMYCGAKPVFVDINLDTFTIDFNQILKKISNKTKAIIVVHLFGYCVDIKKLKKMIPKRIKIIEDAACAAGAKINNNFAGTLGDAGAFSFHPRKIITTGEGGMITTNNKMIEKKIRSLLNHGSGETKNILPFLMPDFKLLGFNYRMTDLQASVGLAQVKKLKYLLEFREKYANYYSQNLKTINWLKLPKTETNMVHGWQAYVVLVDRKKIKISRNMILKKLYNKKIYARPGTHAIHLLSFYRNKFNFKKNSFPNSYIADQNTIALPLHNRMSKSNFDKIINVLREI